MSKHTPGPWKKLAKAARELAMECAAGTAPKFGRGFRWRQGRPCCTLGHVERFAGLKYASSDVWPKDVYVLIAQGNDDASDADRNDAVIFPLLAAADELEALS